MSGTVSKHVALVGELASLMERHNLLEVSETEQELACQEAHSQHLQVHFCEKSSSSKNCTYLKIIPSNVALKMLLQHVKRLIANEKVRHEDAAKLVMLYSLRYENHSNNDTTGLIESLKRRGVSDRLIKVCDSGENIYLLNTKPLYLILFTLIRW